MSTAHDPIHPGEILREEYLRPMGNIPDRLSEASEVPAQEIAEILQRARSITAEVDRALATTLGTSAGFWVGLQVDYDRAVGRQSL